MIIAGSLPC